MDLTGKYPGWFSFPPLGPFILRIPALYFDTDIMKGGIVVNMILGLCIISVLVLISKEILFSDLIATGLGIIAAVHPSLVHYSCHLLRENTFLLFSSLAVLCALRHMKFHTRRNVVFSAVFTVMATLCRHEGIELLAVFCVLFFLNPTKPDCATRFKTVFLFLISGFAALFLISYAVGISSDFYLSYPHTLKNYFNEEAETVIFSGKMQ